MQASLAQLRAKRPSVFSGSSKNLTTMSFDRNFTPCVADNSDTLFSVMNGNSKFVDGLPFMITSAECGCWLTPEESEAYNNAKTQVEKDEILSKKRKHYTFSTNIPDAVLYLTQWSSTNVKLDATNKVVELDGTFDKWFIAMRNKFSGTDTSAMEFCKKVATAMQGKQLVVKRKFYNGLNNFAQIRTLSVRTINFANPEDAKIVLE